MWLIRLAMTRPVTIMVAVATTVILSIPALTRMNVDIFPQLDWPRVPVIQPYLGSIPVKQEDNRPAVYLRDIAKIEDTTDILTGYAPVNGRRTVYMAVSLKKRIARQVSHG